MTRFIPVASLLAALLLLAACDVLFPTPVPIMTDDLPNPQVGVRYDFNPSTHCGLHDLRIDGAIWVPVGGDVESTAEHPFADGLDQGSVVLTDADHGIYTSEAGFEVPIERVIGPEPTPDGCL
jgi:hypothetical protein